MLSRISPRDTITLTGLTALGHHGVFESERRDGQTFRVDAELSVDFAAAARSDALADTVSYAVIAERIEAAITGEPFDLIEALADHIARDLLGCDARLAAVHITVHKPQAPLPQSFHDVSVTARRTRADLEPAEPEEQLWDAGRAPEAPVRVVLALGSNLGDSAETLASAVAALEADTQVQVISQSPLALTRPVGGPPGQPEFCNQVIEITTTHAPQELLRLTQRIEQDHHRVRGRDQGEVRWGPRTLDVDIITYAQARVDSATLQIPHPRAAERGFVLVPWSWMDPTAELEGHAVAELAARAGDSATVRRAERGA